MNHLLLVGAGGAVGAMARYLAGVGYGRTFGPNHPYLATMIVNVTGGLIMGLLIGYLAFRGGAGSERLRLLLGVGVLGGYTTFSSFSLEAVMMLEKRTYGVFVGYVAGSVVFSILALMLGLMLARRAFS